MRTLVARATPYRIAVGALSGAVATAVWAALEPASGRALGHSYSDVRMLGRFATGERAWAPAGIAIHLANGAAFGTMMALTGPLTPRRAAAFVAVETVVTWPMMAVADRVHPDRRSGRWPRLLTSRRIMAHEAIMHAVFAAVLALLFHLFGGRNRRG
jgi:hypothetical protein